MMAPEQWQKFKTLEVGNGALKRGYWVVVALVVLASLQVGRVMLQTQAELSAAIHNPRNLLLQDQAGEDRVIVGLTGEGPQLTFLGKQGSGHAELAITEQETFLTLTRAAGEPAIRFGIKAGEPWLTLFQPDGVPGSELLLSNLGLPDGLYDMDPLVRARLVLLGDASGLELLNSSDAVAVTIRLTSTEAQVNFLKDQETLAQLILDAGTVRADLYDGQAFKRASLIASQEGTAEFVVFGEGDQPRLALRQGAAGPELFIHNVVGKASESLVIRDAQALALTLFKSDPIPLPTAPEVIAEQGVPSKNP